ncbi:MAG: helix-turn-helix domain-containing protein [Ktedonobacteraceae bacterium]|nr:helix-turn-helix domain-containing protein [Ktedonobacteraceae bacterium]
MVRTDNRDGVVALQRLIGRKLVALRNAGEQLISNLRSSTGLSLEGLARLIGTSKSTLSRLENDEIAQPFRGTMRKLVLSLAQVLCTSRRETERYLELAGIDRSLLTDTEEIQLGFVPSIVPGSSDEEAQLERLARIYKELLGQLEAKEAENGDKQFTAKSQAQNPGVHQHLAGDREKT